jgi:hypothetical protein
MFSIDNFYHILDSNFLKNTDIQLFYFYPFGTTDTKNLVALSVAQQQEVLATRLPKMSVLFYDQEPLSEQMVWKKKYQSLLQLVINSPKSIKILANSELSPFKDHLCKENNLHDWYYFFHGLAALDWYRDYQYITHTSKFNKKFLCLNRIVTGDRSYRLELVANIMSQGLLEHGDVSLAISNTPIGDWRSEISSPDTKLTDNAIVSIKKQIGQLTGPLTVDLDSPDASCSAHVGSAEMAINQSALWHVVSETVFYYNKKHLTEKIFKPIVNKRPFLLVGARGNLAYLKSYGFKTFDNWIDESYDLEVDPSRRLEMITEQLSFICSLDTTQLDTMYQEMMPVIEHNYNHFFGNFKDLVVSEMLDNFFKIVNEWNNTCPEGRSINFDNVDYNTVKSKLLS